MPTLSWIGKEKVVNHHAEVPFRVLEHKYGYNSANPESSAQTGSGNKIIHGDNLEALKALLPEFEGMIDCEYIDPPYNTGNEAYLEMILKNTIGPARQEVRETLLPELGKDGTGN